MNDEEVRGKISETGKKEREALTGLFKLMLKESDKVYYTIYHTPDQTIYDCLVKKFDRETGKVIKKMFFETKIRGAYYDTMLLEKQKLESLKALIRDKDIDKIYYVNFTPRNAILFDLIKIEHTLFFVEQQHNKLTVDKERGKAAKSVAYIDVTDGIVFDYIYSPETNTSTTPPVPFLSEKEVDHILSLQNAFPKEDVILAVAQIPDEINPPSDPNQTKLEIVEIKIAVKFDENGEVAFNTSEEFQSFPYHIQWRYVMENYLRKFLLPDEEKHVMIDKYGSLEKVYLFVRERTRQKFLAMYGHFVEEPNEYEIK
jgi:hypothetical protein